MPALKKIIKKIVVFCFFGFLVLGPGVSPVWAGVCGVGPNKGYTCCLINECQGKNSGPQDCVQTPNPKMCCESCLSPEGNISEISNPVIGIFGTQPGNLTIAYVFATIMRLALVGAGLMLLFYLISAGLQWMTSGGEKTSVAAARDKISNAFIGLILVVLVLVIIAVVNEVLQINILQPELPTP